MYILWSCGGLTPRSLEGGYVWCRRTCCIHLQGSITRKGVCSSKL